MARRRDLLVQARTSKLAELMTASIHASAAPALRSAGRTEPEIDCIVRRTIDRMAGLPEHTVKSRNPWPTDGAETDAAATNRPSVAAGATGKVGR